MRNLILAGKRHLQSESLTVPDLQLADVCIDPIDSTSYLIYQPSKDFNSIEIQKVTVCLSTF